MAAFNFPNSPSTNDLHTENSVTWKWNGTVWKRVNNSYLTASTLDVTGIGTFGSRVLIGTATEGNAGSDDLTIATSGSTGITVRSGTSSNGNLYFSDGTSGDDEYRGSIQYQHANNALVFATDAAERLRIYSSGNVNFGAEKAVALPSGTGIQVYHSSAPRIKLVTDTTGNAAGDGLQIYVSGSSAIFDQKENAEMRFYTNATEKLRITSSGFIGVGVASPNHMLQLHRSDSNNSYTQYTNSTTGSAASDGVWLGMGGDEVCYLWHQENKDMRLGTNNTERVRITAGGNFLIGGTNTNYYSANLVLSAGNAGGMTIAASSTSDANFITFADAASSPGYLAGGLKYRHDTDALILRAGAAEKVEVQSAGHLKINDGDLIIGTSGHGISFAATSDASGMWGETLDDYEHGSFTPTTYGWGTATPYAGSSYNSGWYVKIGDIVHVGWKIYYNTLSGSNSHIGIGGFPFNSAGNHVSIAPVRFDVPETAVTYDLIYYMGSSGSTVWMYQKNSSGGITAINSSGNRSNVWAMGQVTYYSG